EEGALASDRPAHGTISAAGRTRTEERGDSAGGFGGEADDAVAGETFRILEHEARQVVRVSVSEVRDELWVDALKPGALEDAGRDRLDFPAPALAAVDDRLAHRRRHATDGKEHHAPRIRLLGDAVDKPHERARDAGHRVLRLPQLAKGGSGERERAVLLALDQRLLQTVG